MFLIILSSIGLALFFYFLEYFLTRFTRSVSSPEATIYKSVIRVKYWDSRDDIFIKDIIGYKFNRVIINSIEISVLVLQLKKDRVFEIGLPNIEFEENYRLYELLKDKSYLETAYNQVQELADNLEPDVAAKFLSYPIPKAIVEEWEKVK